MRRAFLALPAIVALLASCSIGTDDSPRGIDPSGRPALNLPPLGGAGAGGSARIYFLAEDTKNTAAHLLAVARDVAETPDALLAALFEGPNSEERANEIRTAVPATTTLLGADVESGLVVVNVSKDLQELSGEVLVDAIAQIVFTAAETGVDNVRIEIEGEPRQWPDGAGELRSGPLTSYDFPGLVESAQPAYPADPSPEP